MVLIESVGNVSSRTSRYLALEAESIERLIATTAQQPHHFAVFLTAENLTRLSSREILAGAFES